MTRRLLLLAAGCVLVPLAAGQSNTDTPDKADKKAQQALLEEAERLLLRAPTEANVREGGKLCLDLDSPAAVELLLKVLNREQPHYRDIVWEVLPYFTDPYARERIAVELRDNQRNALVREWCAELLGRYRDADFGKFVLKALADPELPVVRAAVRSCGQLKYAPAVHALQPLVNRTDIYLRELAIEALARIDPVAHEALFVRGLADQDGGVRCALLGALPSIWPEQAQARSAAALADKDWRPRLQAVENLERIRTKGSVDALVEAATDARPVVARRAAAALEKLTAQRMVQAAMWRAWWAEHRASFAFPAGTASRPQHDRDKDTVTYHGIDVVSDHIAFLIDKSATMRAPSSSKGKSKDTVAFEELEALLGKVRERKLTFNVFLYENDVVALHKDPVVLGKTVEAAALAFVKKGSIKGNKNIWQALETVVSDADLDTVYLLSSGEPEVGVYVHWNRVTEHLQELNRFHKVVVHTVAYSDSKWYRDQMQKIAEATGGQFRGFE